MAALKHNYEIARATGKKVMCVIKADAYGHGRQQCAQAMMAAGADYLGVAQLAEAPDLRQEVGPEPQILTWLFASWGQVLVLAMPAQA